MRMLGMHGTAFANYAVEDCDFLITLGARFDDRVAGSPAKFAPRARCIAQFDIDPAEINKVKPVAWHHVGDLKDSLRSLLVAGPQARHEAGSFGLACRAGRAQARSPDGLRSRQRRWSSRTT